MARDISFFLLLAMAVIVAAAALGGLDGVIRHDRLEVADNWSAS